jgi:ATP-binding cassette subfamily B protein
VSIEPTIRDVAQKTEIGEIIGEIEFRNLTFKYNDASAPALAGINLRIAPGQTVAFVGAVGSGQVHAHEPRAGLLDAEPGRC